MTTRADLELISLARHEEVAAEMKLPLCHYAVYLKDKYVTTDPYFVDNICDLPYGTTLFWMTHNRSYQ